MIGTWSLAAVAQVLAVNYNGEDVSFGRISTDTRTLQPGDLFVALSGPNFDGNRFVVQAAEKGACGAVVSAHQAVDLPQVVVPDCREALGQLGAFNRLRFTGQVAAITGSSGKTSVKEMLAEVLRQQGPVLATRGNLNNEIGVPLTLLELEAEHQFGVIELGASGPGEIAYTVELTKPQVAVLNNAGGAHLEGFGSLDGVVKAKGEIFDGLDENGTGVVNLDDPHALVWLGQLAGQRILTFSLINPAADLFASHLELDDRGCYGFVLNTHQDQARVQLQVIGRHAVANGLAAACAAFALGVPLSVIAEGLSQFAGVPGRLMVRAGLGGLRVIDDTYNANPDSVKAAINVLADLPGPKVLVLGNMAELGDESVRLHAEIGDYARERGIDQLVTVGELAEHAAAAFGQGVALADCQSAAQWVLDHIEHQAVVLVKGSRSSHMEAVVSALMDKETSTPCC